MRHASQIRPEWNKSINYSRIKRICSSLHCPFSAFSKSEFYGSNELIVPLGEKVRVFNCLQAGQYRFESHE